MQLTGRFVHFWLSPSGKDALDDKMPGGADFEALVVEENDVGLWIWMPKAPESRDVTLLKWEYFATASLEYEPPDALPEKAPAGFRQSS